jgi:hypothetical protein
MSYKPKKGAIQPIVLYSEDGTAIDTGKIAGDLKLVKDNQGLNSHSRVHK